MKLRAREEPIDSRARASRCPAHVSQNPRTSNKQDQVSEFHGRWSLGPTRTRNAGAQLAQEIFRRKMAMNTPFRHPRELSSSGFNHIGSLFGLFGSKSKDP